MESTSSPGTVSQAPQPPTPPALPKGHSEVRDATFLNLYRLISQELSTRDDTSVYTAFQRGYAKTSPYYEQALDNTLGENWDQYNGLPLSIALSRMDKGIIDETVTMIDVDTKSLVTNPTASLSDLRKAYPSLAVINNIPTTFLSTREERIPTSLYLCKTTNDGYFDVEEGVYIEKGSGLGAVETPTLQLPLVHGDWRVHPAYVYLDPTGHREPRNTNTGSGLSAKIVHDLPALRQAYVLRRGADFIDDLPHLLAKGHGLEKVSLVGDADFDYMVSCATALSKFEESQPARRLRGPTVFECFPTNASGSLDGDRLPLLWEALSGIKQVRLPGNFLIKKSSASTASPLSTLPKMSGSPQTIVFQYSGYESAEDFGRRLTPDELVRYVSGTDAYPSRRAEVTAPSYAPESIRNAVHEDNQRIREIYIERDRMFESGTAKTVQSDASGSVNESASNPADAQGGEA